MKAVASEDFETGVSERWAEAFRNDRRQFETLFSKMLNGFAYHRIIVDDNGKPVDYIFLAVNKCFEDLTGLKRDILIGRKVTELLPGIENDPADWIGAYGKVALTGEPLTFENFSLSLKKWYSVSAYSPRKGYFVAIFEDITERKKVQEALRESEQRWSTTLSSIGDAVISTDVFGKITFMNHEAETLTGWSLSDASQKPVKSVFKIINEQSRLEVESPIDRVLKEGIVVGLANHTILVRKNDSEIPIDDSGAPIKDKDGKITGVVLIFRDITERKKAEDTLRESEIKFKAVANLTHDWEYWIAPDGSILFMSPSCKRFSGYTAEEFTENPKLLIQIVHPQDRKQFDSHCKLVSSDKSFEVDFRIISRDGLTHWVSHVCRPVFDDEGKWIGRRVSNREITKRKKAEEEIERLALFPTQNPNPIIEVGLDGTVSYCNPAAKKTFPDLERLGSEHPFLYGLQNTSKALQRESACSLEREVEVEEKWFNQQFYLVPNRKLIRIYSINITERKKAERELMKYQENLEALIEERTNKLKDAERLAAIGATAGMVGHDIRNPLQAITSDVFLAKTELASLPSSEEKKNALESMVEIEKNIDYINKIVQDLQDYARPLNPKIEENDLRSTVEAVIRKNGCPKNIKVNIEITDETTKIRVDSYYLNRILTNLISNAVQAMPNGGKLTITANKEADDTILSVKDTGTGIPQKIQNKMFILMFTTKSKGQGFGLPVVKRLTESLGGSVTFESQEGKGTTFIVRLPPKELNGKLTYKNSG
jgi:PAS domain S-box-containing protein